MRRIALFSGGHDSASMTHFSLGRVDMAAHIVTGIGISQTTQYVEERCEDWGLPLVKKITPKDVYRRFVLDPDSLYVNKETKHSPGFPGPSAHQAVYYYLKQMRLRELRAEYGEVEFFTGVRKQESSRRFKRAMAVPERKEGKITWINPILDWTKLDVNHYMNDQGIPRNPVVDHLERSGECLCGAFASRRELPQIKLFYPEVAAEIEELEHECRMERIPRCYWGGGSAGKMPPWNPDQLEFSGMELCQSCEARI